ncbi:MAG: hypothetical protein GPOALKHO_001641 [Sodalis sp.]|nr:MAG: hypothetical protein GPOALKHO_001641 [Sodalis sp.]
MVLTDIAKAADMYEFTILHVTTKKWLHSQSSIFELKYFSQITSISKVEAKHPQRLFVRW